MCYIGIKRIYLLNRLGLKSLAKKTGALRIHANYVSSWQYFYFISFFL